MSATTVEELKNLMSKRDAIEAEIKELSDVLESQKAVGMDGPLLDAEQFPRSDIDLYTVREARHKIICLQNDHKLLMKQIEDGLYELHAKTRAQREAEQKQAVDTVMDVDEQDVISKAFVRVDHVDGGSPAHQAGLEVGDLIVRFGSITSENFSTLQDIGKLTQHSVRKTISITVVRSGKEISLGLMPRKWDGQGLLGCNVVPLKKS